MNVTEGKGAFAITELEESLFGADGSARADEIVLRLSGLVERFERVRAEGLGTDEFASAETLLRALIAARRFASLYV